MFAIQSIVSLVEGYAVIIDRTVLLNLAVKMAVSFMVIELEFVGFHSSWHSWR